jgi:hypothetical protein
MEKTDYMIPNTTSSLQIILQLNLYQKSKNPWSTYILEGPTAHVGKDKNYPK